MIPNGAAALGWAAFAAPVLLFAALALRSARLSGKRWVALLTLLLGAAAYAPAYLLERGLERWTGLDMRAASTPSLAALVYTFLVVAPLYQGMTVAAVAPVHRSRHTASGFDGVVFSAAAGLGFATALGATFWASRGFAWIDLGRAMLALPAHAFFAALWGYVLGREASHRIGGRRFNRAWLVALVFNGLYDHIVFWQSESALLAAAPMLLTMGVIAFATRDLVLRDPKRKHDATRRILRAIAPPSLKTMREALRRSERPVTLSWIAFGALVTVGVMTVSLALAVLVGRSLGVDFAAVDNASSGASSAPPLALLGAAALLAFPIAGFFVARASAVRTVLEPAMSAGVAIAASLVLLGLAAPLAVVFAIAFAPVAFGLACAGAWVGLGR